MQFDIATALLMDAVVTLMIGVLMLVVASALPRGLYSILRLWGYSDVLIALGLLALGLRDGIGIVASVLLANGLILFGVFHQYSALRRFNGRPSRPRNFLPVLLLALLLLWLGTTVWPSIEFRIVLVSVLLGGLGIANCRLAIEARRHAAPSSGWMMAGVFALLVGLFVALSLRQLFGDAGARLFDTSSPVPAIVLVGGGLLPMLAAVAFLLMCVERSLTEAHRLAITDSLTGCYNRRWIEELAQRQLSRRLVPEMRVALLLVDLDRFKQINDAHGHAVGDAVLRGVVLRMESTLRSADVLGRIGGEEFLVLLEGADESRATEVGERIRQAIITKPLEVEGKQLPVSASVGVAVQNHDGETLDTLLRRADRGLYAAKKGGRNAVRLESTAWTTPV